MKKIWIILSLLTAMISVLPACGDDDDSAADSGADADTDSDADTDADTDTDTDADGDDLGEACTILIQNFLTILGTCGADAASCTAGFSPIEGTEQGSCKTDLICCVNDDQCDAVNDQLGGLATVACQVEPCDTDQPYGGQYGCPNSEYCCMTGIDTDSGGDTDTDVDTDTDTDVDADTDTDADTDIDTATAAD